SRSPVKLEQSCCSTPTLGVGFVALESIELGSHDGSSRTFRWGRRQFPSPEVHEGGQPHYRLQLNKSSPVVAEMNSEAFLTVGSYSAPYPQLLGFHVGGISRLSIQINHRLQRRRHESPQRVVISQRMMQRASDLFPGRGALVC